MSLVDALLKIDAGKITTEEKTQFEVERLSKILGEPFVLVLQEIPSKRFTEIQEAAVKMDKRGRYKETDVYGMKMRVVCEGIIEPDFSKDKDLMKKYGAATPKELFEKILKAGEVQDIYSAIEKLSGYDKDGETDIKEIKN